MAKELTIKRNRAKCFKCGDVVESTHVHDFKYCSCKSMAVDGGPDYLRRLGNLTHMEDLSEFTEDLEETGETIE